MGFRNLQEKLEKKIFRLDERVVKFPLIFNNGIYITIARGLGGLVRKLAIFAVILYCIYADILSEWVGMSEKVQEYANVIYGWPPNYPFIV